MKILIELERHECRWPILCVGEGEGFCAEHVEGIDSYCALHRQIAGGGRTVTKDRPTREDRCNGHASRLASIAASYHRERAHEPDLFELLGLES